MKVGNVYKAKSWTLKLIREEVDPLARERPSGEEEDDV